MAERSDRYRRWWSGRVACHRLPRLGMAEHNRFWRKSGAPAAQNRRFKRPV